jgi:hypothetical protein
VLSNPNHPLTKELTKLFKLVKSKLGDRYGTKNVDEFASELISNEEFQQEIKALENGNIFTRIMRAITQFLFSIPPKASIFDQAVDTVTDIIDMSGQVLRKDNEFGGRRGQVNPNVQNNTKGQRKFQAAINADEAVRTAGAMYAVAHTLTKKDFSRLKTLFKTTLSKAQRFKAMEMLTTRRLFELGHEVAGEVITSLNEAQKILFRYMPEVRNTIRMADNRVIDQMLKWGGTYAKNLTRLGEATNAARIYQISPAKTDNIDDAIANDETVKYYDSRIKDPNYRNNKAYNQKRKDSRIKEIIYTYKT